MTNPRRQSRNHTPEHRDSISKIHLQMEKASRVNRISKLKSRMALISPDEQKDRELLSLNNALEKAGEKPGRDDRVDRMDVFVDARKKKLGHSVTMKKEESDKTIDFVSKGIKIRPSLKRRFSKLKTRIARLKSSMSISKGMIQLKNQSADSIINGFIKGKHNIRGVSGVFDPVENRILDALKPNDAIRLQKIFKSGTNKIGFNSITDTRQGQATNVELIRKQLRNIEKGGGVPALGFDEGSLEALDVTTDVTDDGILSRLKGHQRSTGILDSDGTFRIVNNRKFQPNK